MMCMRASKILQYYVTWGTQKGHDSLPRYQRLVLCHITGCCTGYANLFINPYLCHVSCIMFQDFVFTNFKQERQFLCNY